MFSPAAPAAGSHRRMARRHKSAEYPVHFISGDVRGKIPLFKIRPEFAKLFLDTLCFYRKEKRIRVFAYVVMPDHYHLLLGLPADIKVSDFLRDFKSYVGKQVVERLRGDETLKLLERFAAAAPPSVDATPPIGCFSLTTMSAPCILRGSSDRSWSTFTTIRGRKGWLKERWIIPGPVVGPT